MVLRSFKVLKISCSTEGESMARTPSCCQQTAKIKIGDFFFITRDAEAENEMGKEENEMGEEENEMGEEDFKENS